MAPVREYAPHSGATGCETRLIAHTQFLFLLPFTMGSCGSAIKPRERCVQFTSPLSCSKRRKFGPRRARVLILTERMEQRALSHADNSDNGIYIECTAALCSALPTLAPAREAKIRAASQGRRHWSVLCFAVGPRRCGQAAARSSCLQRSYGVVSHRGRLDSRDAASVAWPKSREPSRPWPPRRSLNKACQ